jgi:hypothetical protein
MYFFTLLILSGSRGNHIRSPNSVMETGSTRNAQPKGGAGTVVLVTKNRRLRVRFPWRRGVRYVAVVGPDHDDAERAVARAFVNVERGPEDGPYRCPCCGSLTLPTRGGFELCPVCFWEDDGQDDHDADEVRCGPNGNLSLTQARANYGEFGASDRTSLPRVRPPNPRERPAR